MAPVYFFPNMSASTTPATAVRGPIPFPAASAGCCSRRPASNLQDSQQQQKQKQRRSRAVQVCSNKIITGEVKPADSLDSPFRELDLAELWDGIGKTRVRQHVNPLRREYQTPLAPPEWSTVFADPSKPLVLDLGCGYGRFLLLLHKKKPDWDVNYLGIEIRQPLVDRANEWVKRLGYQGKVHYINTNATISLQGMLATYPGPLEQVYIQFPDPHFKRRHKKRRIFQPSLVHAIEDRLKPGGLLFLQSDVETVSIAMRNIFEKYAGSSFAPAAQHEEQPVFCSPTPSHAIDSSSLSNSTPNDASVSGSNTAASLGAHASAQASLGTALPSSHAASQQSASSPAASTSATQHHSISASAGTPTDNLSNASSQQEDRSGQHASAQHQPPHGSHKHDGTSASDAATLAVDGVETDDSDQEPVEAGDAQDDYENLDSQWAKAGWLVNNPLGVPTEREHYVMQQGLPVYRLLLQRT